MDSELKHFKAPARERRFEKTHYGNASATLRKVRYWANDLSHGMELDIQRPENSEFLVSSTAIDDMYGIAVARPHGLSQMELLDLLEHLTQEFPSKESTDTDTGKISTTVSVPSNALEMGMKTLIRQKARFAKLQVGVGGEWTVGANNQWIQSKPCKIIFRISDVPLSSVSDASLLDKHSSISASTSQKGTRPENAVINNHCDWSCWLPPLVDLESQFLQVDLRSNCDVTYISTQGRFPKPISKPRNNICQFTGARIVVDSFRDTNEWVWKYRVMARENGGRTWFPLGDFNGNRDRTTEVAHKLFAPVRCRYLRFYVLGYDVTPAMRVGVYGVRPGGTEAAKVVVHDDIVKYEFTRAAAGSVMRHLPTNVSRRYHSCRCSYCRGFMFQGKRGRHLRRLGASKELPEALSLAAHYHTAKSDAAYLGDAPVPVEKLTGCSVGFGIGRLHVVDRRADINDMDCPESSLDSSDESWLVV